MSLGQQTDREIGVSVVIPCYNGGAYLREAIDSALRQDYPGPVEVIVGNDGSTDDSRDIALSYSSRVVVVEHADGKNHGLPATRNLCIRRATHQYLAFLDADDIWLTGHLTRVVGALDRDRSIALAVDNGLTVTDQGEVWGDRRPNVPPGPLSPENVLLNQWFPPCAVAINASVLRVVGLFDESLGSAEDQDMWLRILEKHPGLFVAGIGYHYRVHAGQMSANPVLWHWAQVALDRARLRHPYSRRVIRKRMATISFRRGQAAWASSSYLRAALHLGIAGCLDPSRALSVISRRSWLV